MRKLCIILTTILLSMSCSIAKSQTEKETKITFEKELSRILTTVKGVKNTDELFKNINKLKRLSLVYPSEWLSDYYIALFNIKLSIITKDKQKKELLLKDVKKTLKILKEKENFIESEILTIEGYYYYALIVQNPKKNGQLYYKDVISAYQKAIAIDKNNPRPELMLLLFQKSMSQSLGNKFSNFCEKLSKIEKLFNSFEPIGNIYPQWGLNILKREKQRQKCN